MLPVLYGEGTSTEQLGRGTVSQRWACLSKKSAGAKGEENSAARRRHAGGLLPSCLPPTSHHFLRRSSFVRILGAPFSNSSPGALWFSRLPLATVQGPAALCLPAVPSRYVLVWTLPLMYLSTYVTVSADRLYGVRTTPPAHTPRLRRASATLYRSAAAGPPWQHGCWLPFRIFPSVWYRATRAARAARSLRRLGERRGLVCLSHSAMHLHITCLPASCLHSPPAA